MWGFAADILRRSGTWSAAQAKQKIDAQGKVVAPGFIDMLGQSELTILVDPRLPSKIFQGITTEITGEGNSVAPVNDAMLAADRAGYDALHITPDWRTLREYFARLEKQGMGINLATYVGATSVRRMVLGDANVQPTAGAARRDEGAGSTRRCAMGRLECRLRCSIRRRLMRRRTS